MSFAVCTAGSESFYSERADKLNVKCTVFQQSIYGLMALLQSVEEEYLTKCGKLPKGTRAVDWRNEYDPKQYRLSGGHHGGGGHQTSQTVGGNVERKRRGKKGRKSKHQMETSSSATELMDMAHEERWGGFGLGSSGDDQPKEPHSKVSKSTTKLVPRHRGKGKENGSIFMDL